jgi:hypothetical protein
MGISVHEQLIVSVQGKLIGAKLHEIRTALVQALSR